jgi:hypothetical protein
MGKLTLRGPVPKDHPMFSGGPEVLSRPESRPSSKNSLSATVGATPLMATSNSPTCGHSNSPRQDGRIMGFLPLSEWIAMLRCRGGCLSGLQLPVGLVRGGGPSRGVLIPSSNRLFGQAKRVRP